MRNSILILSMVLSTLCFAQTSDKKFAKFSGTIENVQQTEMMVLGEVDGKRRVKRIIVNEDGSFSDTLQISDGKFTLFLKGPKLSGIKMRGDKEPRKEVFGITAFFKAGSETHFEVDAADFRNTLEVSGDYTAYAMYNYKKDNIVNGFTPKEKYKELYLLDENSFKNKNKELKNKKEALLEAYDIQVEGFKAEESRQINYEYLYSLVTYEQKHAEYSEDEGFKVGETFLNELSEISYDNGKDFKRSQTYQRLVYFAIEKGGEALSVKESIPLDVAKLRYIGTFRDEDLKNLMLMMRARSTISKTENITELFNEYMKWSTDKSNDDMIAGMYKKLNVLVKGSPSPKFENYENYSGGTTSLDDLIGKYVYIDVWATWCGPCKYEIPFLKEVEKKYHGKNIEFVSISVDKQRDRQKWIDMVKDMELGGIQLLADKDSKSQWYQDYAIKGIPRFILLDKEGKIISADALRPSDPKLIEVLNGLDL